MWSLSHHMAHCVYHLRIICEAHLYGNRAHGTFAGVRVSEWVSVTLHHYVLRQMNVLCSRSLAIRKCKIKIKINVFGGYCVRLVSYAKTQCKTGVKCCFECVRVSVCVLNKASVNRFAVLLCYTNRSTFRWLRVLPLLRLLLFFFVSLHNSTCCLLTCFYNLLVAQR